MAILRVKQEDGTWADIPAIAGAPGADGYTPVKGTDYYTTAEKEALIAEIKTALYNETWEFELEDGSTVTKVVHIG